MDVFCCFGWLSLKKKGKSFFKLKAHSLGKEKDPWGFCRSLHHCLSYVLVLKQRILQAKPAEAVQS